MADEKAKKTTKSAAAGATKKAAAPKAAAGAEPAAAPAATASAPKKAAAPKVAVVSKRGTCTVAGCKQPLRAKRMCRKHYIGWRRGDVGTAHRYNTCSKEACRKKAIKGGCCEEHMKGAKPAAGAEGAPAA